MKATGAMEEEISETQQRRTLERNDRINMNNVADDYDDVPDFNKSHEDYYSSISTKLNTIKGNFQVKLKPNKLFEPMNTIYADPNKWAPLREIKGNLKAIKGPKNSLASKVSKESKNGDFSFDFLENFDEAKFTREFIDNAELANPRGVDMYSHQDYNDDSENEAPYRMDISAEYLEPVMLGYVDSYNKYFTGSSLLTEFVAAEEAFLNRYTQSRLTINSAQHAGSGGILDSQDNSNVFYL